MLQSQKKIKAKNIRNVLGIPFNIQWSESSPEGVASLQKALEELLPLAKLEKKNLKLNSNGETHKESLASTPLVENHNSFRKYLSLGFQSVIRGLERHELCCVLMSSDISPPMIQRVVCSYCSTNYTPLMIVPQLKTITKAALGFSTMVLGLKKIHDSAENPFSPIYEITLQNRSIFEIPFVAKKEEEIGADNNNKCITANENSSVSSAKSEDFYLYRKSVSERVFRPGINSTVNSELQNPCKTGMDGDFIFFSKSGPISSDFKLIDRNISNIDSKNDSEDDESECDSLDEENIFFVDNKPDQMLLDSDLSNNQEKDSETNGEFQISNLKSSLNQEAEISAKNKVSNERYFSGKVKNLVKPKKNKEKKKTKQKPEHSFNIERIGKKEKFASSKFNPLTIKTIISNPKKIRRKMK